MHTFGDTPRNPTMAALRIITVLFLVASAIATDFLECQDGFPPKAVSITDCDAAIPVCSMFTGRTYDVNATFVTDRVVNVLRPTVTLTPLGGNTIELPLGDDVCSLVVTGCPIQPGTDAVLSWPVTISGTNLGAYTAQLRLDDENGGNVACAIVEILII